MAENVGAIYFTVEADTEKLLHSIKPADSSLDSLNKTFARTDKAASQTSFQMNKTAAAIKGIGTESQASASSLGGLMKALGGLLTLQGANVLIQMAESYREMGERIRFATASQEEYEMVQQRLLATANGTYRALSEAQEVYILTADSLRSMGYTTEQALDITDSLSYAFVKNATSADRGANATRAYSNAIMKGKVEADGWSTIISAVPSLIQDIAAASGLSAEEVRKLGAEGKLTAQMLNEGLRQSLDSNKAAADGMATTVRDAFNNMRNSLSVYLGESQSATSATGLLSNAILLLGNNIETVVNVLMTVGAGALAKYIAQTGAAAIASGKAMLAARAKAAEDIRLAQATVAATQASLAHAQANAGLAGSFATLTAAQKANQAATTALATAQKAAAASGATLMGMLGGPVGIIALLATAAAGMYMFSGGADKARDTLNEMDAPLESIIEKFQRLSEAQRAEALVRNTKAQALAAEEAEDAFANLLNSISSVNSFRTDWSVSQWRAFREEIQTARKAGEDLTPIIQRAARDSGVSQEAINTWLELNGELDRADGRMARAAEVGAALSAEATNLANATRDAASGQRDLNAALAGFDGESGDALKKLQDRVAALQDGNSEVKKAERYLASLTNVSEEYRTAYMSAALAADALAEANKRNTAGTKAGAKAADERKKAEEENAKTIAKLAESLYQAGLSGEALAIAKARASLNEFVTPEQLKQVEDLARALYQVETLQKLREKVGDDPSRYIRGTVTPLSGGAFDDQAARYEAEVAVEEQRYADQLTRLREAMEAQKLTLEQYHAEFEHLQKVHSDRLAQIEQAKNQVLLGSGEQLFGALADAAKTYAGESSGIYRALFAASKAFAIAQATLNLSSAISQAMADPTAVTPAQKFANMAAVGAAGAQLIGAITSATYGGGRQYGGPVSPGKMYRINENGAPEVYNAANGQQFLLPNTRGQVVSNKDATGGGDGGAAPIVNVVIHNAPPGSTVERRQGTEREEIVEVFIADVREGGPASQALEMTYGLGRIGA